MEVQLQYTYFNIHKKLERRIAKLEKKVVSENKSEKSEKES